MKTPAKYRDRLLMAATRFKEGTLSEGRLMQIIDTVIDDCAAPRSIRAFNPDEMWDAARAAQHAPNKRNRR